MSIFSVIPYPHPSIAAHIETPFVKTVTFNEEHKRFRYEQHGRPVEATGLKFLIEIKYHKHYKRNRSKRRGTNIVGSSSKEGTRVDDQIAMWTAGQQVKRPNKLAVRFWRYWKENGHTVQAAQLPVQIPLYDKVTQADVITMDRNGKLWLWECKCGAPVGAANKQGVFENIVDVDGKTPVPCTQYMIWQLQLHFTKLALIAAGIPIAESRVLQIHAYRDTTELAVYEREPPPWIGQLKLVDPRNGWTPQVAKKRVPYNPWPQQPKWSPQVPKKRVRKDEDNA